MNYEIEGQGALVNEKGEETPLKAGAFKMICGVPKEFEWFQNIYMMQYYQGISFYICKR